MKHRRSIDKLAKFLAYVLGRQPDEFGLIPDENGFVKIKDLIKSLGEEPGWRHVRLNHIHEAIYATGSPTVEVQNNLIRAKDQTHRFFPKIPDGFPKLLYCAVRQRAYPVLLEKGLHSANSANRIVLSSDIAMARRLGRRIDPSAVILTVNSAHAQNGGATLWRFGKLLFLSDCLPLGSFHGPPLPNTRPAPKQGQKSKAQSAPKTPGSYHLDLTSDSAANTKPNQRSRQRKNEWKRYRTRISRNKANGWPNS